MWILQSNRWKHLLGGYIIGLGADNWYCAVYVGVGVGGAMEFKDYQRGGKPDLIDFALTAAGAVAGYGTMVLVKGFIT